ncbi:MAG: MFS transporter [Candidatus Bruticola sp.]
MQFFKTMFRALKHKNYRYFFVGQIFSLLGMWMQSLALSWLIFSITGSHQALGLVNFCNQLPVLCLVVFGGIIADKFNKRSILLRTQATCMVLASALAALTILGTPKVWHLYIFAFLFGLTQAFDMPARQALVVELVGKEDLSNAIVLNSSIVNGTRLIGPAVAGVIVDLLGEGWCFAVNAASYIGVISGLLAINLTDKAAAHSADPIQSLKEGFNFIVSSFPLTALLFMLGSLSLLCSAQVVMMPAVAKEVLHGQANTMGILMSASGIGALIGALILATKKSTQGMEKLIAFCMILCGICFILFGNSTNLLWSIMLMLPTGFSIMGQMASSNTLIQSLVPDRMRGRIMSFHAMMFMGGAPIGALLSGVCADKFGIAATFTLAGLCMISIGTAFCFVLRRYRILAARQLSLTERLNVLQSSTI